MNMRTTRKRCLTTVASLLLMTAVPGVLAAATASRSDDDTGSGALPYVYTKWKQFTVKDGLPNDHIFAVKAHGHHVWVGTEDGLARLDKRTGEIRSWKEADGLPWRVVSALEVDERTGDLWIGLFGGGLSRFSGGRFEHWHQLNSGLVNDVVYGVAVEGDNVWAATTAGTSRYNVKTGEWTGTTASLHPTGRSIWVSGEAASWSSTRPRSDGRTTSTLTGRWRSTCTAMTASCT
jgi:hypothetical protein